MRRALATVLLAALLALPGGLAAAGEAAGPGGAGTAAAATATGRAAAAGGATSPRDAGTAERTAAAGGAAAALGATDAAAGGTAGAGSAARVAAAMLAAAVPGPPLPPGPGAGAVVPVPAAPGGPPAAAPVVPAREDAAAAGEGVDWLRVLTKAVTYETLGSFLEAGVFLAFYGGGAATAGTIFGAAMLGAGAVYVVHEYAWEALLPPEAPRADPTLVAIKTVTYRALSMARSFATGSILGGGGAVTSGGYAVTLALLDSGLYALTEFAFAWWHGGAAP